MTDDDIDRAAILARRRRFVLTALGGLTGMAGCQPDLPPPSSPPEEYELAYEPTLPRCEPVLTDALDEAPAPPRYKLTDEQLRAALEAPALDLCIEDPFAELDVEWTEAQKSEKAKAFYLRSERAKAEGDLECALLAMETAYYLIPGKHGLAFKCGELAAALGDCTKAWEYLEHYLVYGDHDRHPEQEQRAKALLDTPELRACERPPAPPDNWSQPQVCLEIAFPEPKQPPPPPETNRERRQRERSERKAERKRKR